MAHITIEDPEIHAKKRVDTGGRIYVGKDYKEKQVRITVELVDEE